MSQIACPICKEPVRLYTVPTARDPITRIEIHGDCPGGFAEVELAETSLESRYTPANAWCPHPERWHSRDWDSAEDEVAEFLGALVAVLRPDVVVETGTAFGVTAKMMAEALARAGVGELHTVELNPERAQAAAVLLNDLPATVHVTSSLEFTPPKGIGFAWFDSLPQLRVPEFERYYPYFAEGAIVGFHDVAPHHGAALWDQIQALEEAGKLLAIRLRTPRGVVLAEVLW